MLAILKHRTYRHLFLAQVIALVGTGLATVALGLLAAGSNATHTYGPDGERRGEGIAELQRAMAWAPESSLLPSKLDLDIGLLASLFL